MWTATARRCHTICVLLATCDCASRVKPAPWKFLKRRSPHVRPPRRMGSDTCRLPSFALQKRKSHPRSCRPCPVCGCICPLRTGSQSQSTWSPGRGSTVPSKRATRASRRTNWQTKSACAVSTHELLLRLHAPPLHAHSHVPDAKDEPQEQGNAAPEPCLHVETPPGQIAAQIDARTRHASSGSQQ